jgi:hypothetical protein
MKKPEILISEKTMKNNLSRDDNMGYESESDSSSSASMFSDSN